jgi:cytochrome c oxidase assembly protein subunit 15
MLCCATFPLIWVGGLVTTYDAGMAVPDWPSTYGYNLFLYPWTTWLFGPFDLLVEHGHRLLGALAGMLTIGLFISAGLSERRLWVICLCGFALMAVIGQGVLGGMRVLLDQRQLAMIHGCTGPGFFALAGSIAVVTSRPWRMAKDFPSVDRSTFAAATLTFFLAYVQLIFGALLRHPSVDGGPHWFRLVVLFHVCTALALAAHILTFAWRTLGKYRGEAWITHPTSLLAALIGVQLLLGMGTWVVKYAWPAQLTAFNFAAGYTVTANSLMQSLVVTAHVATGSLILATSAVLAVRIARLTVWKGAAIPFDIRAKGLAL